MLVRAFLALCLSACLSGCRIGGFAKDPREVWNVELPQRFLDEAAAVTAGVWIGYAYDLDWPGNRREIPRGVFYGLDTRNGTILWRREAKLELAEKSAPDDASMANLFHIGEGLLVYRGSGGILHAVDARTGAEKWRATDVAMALGFAPSLLCDLDSQWRLQLRDAATGVVRRQFDQENYPDARLIAAGNRVYFQNDDVITAIDTQTGEAKFLAKSFMKIAAVREGLLIGNALDEMFVFEAASGQQLWKGDGEYIVIADGVMAVSRVHVGPEYRVHFVEPRTGTEIRSTLSEDYIAHEAAFWKDPATNGIVYRTRYERHFSETSQRLHGYSKRITSWNHWLEAVEIRSHRVLWKTTPVWGWMTAVSIAEGAAIAGQYGVEPGKARVRALRID